MGKGSRKGEPQVSNLDKYVNSEGFNYVGGLGQWGHEFVWRLVKLEAPGDPHCADGQKVSFEQKSWEMFPSTEIPT